MCPDAVDARDRLTLSIKPLRLTRAPSGCGICRVFSSPIGATLRTDDEIVMLICRDCIDDFRMEIR